MPYRRSTIRFLAAACAALLAAAPVLAQTSPAPGAGAGRVTGRVLDRARDPVPYADIQIVGLRLGALTDEKGGFAIPGVPPGTWEIRARALGHDLATQTVKVEAGATATVSFSLGGGKSVRTFEEIEISARKKIDSKTSQSTHRLSAEKLSELPVDNVAQALSTQAGVVAQGGQLHVRGSRGGEIKTHINGVEVTNPLNGQDPNIAMLAISGAELITGGFDAEIGNALSGVVNLNTREGNARFGGDVRWDTDRYGDPSKTFDNFDRFTFGVGGPTAVPNLTYFAAYEGTFQDGPIRSSLTRPHHTLFDFMQFGNRQNNRINTNLKLAWRPKASKHALTFETINNRTIFTPYNHMWSRSGFVQVFFDTSAAGAVTQRFGSWSARREDDSYVPMNMPDHVPTTDDRFQSLAAVWTYMMSQKTALNLRLTQVNFDLKNRVGRKEPWEYETQSPFYWSGNISAGTENNPYYATHGDLPFYNLNSGSTQAVKADLTTGIGRNHIVKSGIEARYNGVRNLGLVAPNLEANGLPGQVRSEYENFNPEGAVYLQDRWTYEGLVLNVGARYDVFTPGFQVSDRDLPSGKRFKQQLSPRLGIAYPISDKDVLSFHYGWTYQSPARNVIYQNRGPGATVQTVGNPDLEPETNVSYQAAMQHLFSRDVSGTFTVFFKDIYGLLRVRQERDDFGNLVNVWSNGDYASARGFEASLTKSFSHKFSCDVSYSYQIATGVASNPAQALQFFNGGALYLPISEQPLDWDQRSTLNLSALVRDPGKWGFRVLWTYGSGVPFTPAFRDDRQPDPVLTNSRWLPSASRLTIDGDKFYRIWGQNVTLFFDARNVLDAKTIAALAQNSFPNNNIDRSGFSDYVLYYTETGRAGGAYLQDINGDNIDDWVPVNDPRVFDEGRHVRAGVKVSF